MLALGITLLKQFKGPIFHGQLICISSLVNEVLENSLTSVDPHFLRA